MRRSWNLLVPLMVATAVLTACAVATIASPQPDRIELRLGVAPFLKPEDLHEEFGRITEYITARTGIPTHLVIATSYDDLGKDLAHGRIDLALFSPFEYVKAQRLGNVNVLLQLSYSGRFSYHGVLVVRADSGLTSIEDLQGRHFAFVDKGSSSGYLYPTVLFVRLGININEYFGQVSFAGSHDKVVQGVLDGLYDGGATYDGGLIQMRQKGIPVDRLRIIAETDPIPQDALAVRADLDPAITENVRVALAEMRFTLPGKVIISRSRQGFGGFAPATDADFDVVRDAERVAAAAARN